MSDVKGFWRELVDKTSLANISAVILVVGGFYYAYTTGNVELVKSAFLIGVGYLLRSATPS